MTPHQIELEKKRVRMLEAILEEQKLVRQHLIDLKESVKKLTEKIKTEK